MDPKIIIYAIGVIFGAGIFVAGVRSMRKDLNGVGRLNRDMLATLIETANPKHREKFIKLLRSRR